MHKTTPPRGAKLSRSSAETTGPIADKLRRDDDRLRDVRRGKHRHRCRIVSQLFPASSTARLADQLPRGTQIMWDSKSAPAALHEQLPHDSGRGYT
jgi:hypothetical protein